MTATLAIITLALLGTQLAMLAANAAADVKRTPTIITVVGLLKELAAITLCLSVIL